MSRTRWILAAFLIVAAVGGGIWYGVQRRAAPTSLVEKIFDTVSSSTDAPDEANPLEEAVGLALKGISLFQGNGGIELWRLKASWAHISQQGDVIDVDKPSVQYALGKGSVSNPTDDILDVEANKGQITDNQKYLSLWDDVVMTRYDDKLTGPRMNYNATTRIMHFPEGAKLESPTAWGTAKAFAWNLGENEMTGDGGVLVVLKARPAPQNEPENQPQIATPQTTKKSATAASEKKKTTHAKKETVHKKTSIPSSKAQTGSKSHTPETKK